MSRILSGLPAALASRCACFTALGNLFFKVSLSANIALPMKSMEQYADMAAEDMHELELSFRQIIEKVVGHVFALQERVQHLEKTSASNKGL